MNVRFPVKSKIASHIIHSPKNVVIWSPDGMLPFTCFTFNKYINLDRGNSLDLFNI